MSRLAICPLVYFDREIGLYGDSITPESVRTGFHLKNDIMETILFVSLSIQGIIKQKQCLSIIGI